MINVTLHTMASSVITVRPSFSNSLGSPAPDKPTLEVIDGLQKKLKTTDFDLLRRWRDALRLRYTVQLKNFSEDFTTIFREIGYDGKDIILRDLRSRSASLPDSLAKSFVQIWRGDTKMITITVHFKMDRRKGGTCMIKVKGKGGPITFSVVGEHHGYSDAFL